MALAFGHELARRRPSDAVSRLASEKLDSRHDSACPPEKVATVGSAQRSAIQRRVSGVSCRGEDCSSRGAASQFPA